MTAIDKDDLPSSSGEEEKFEGNNWKEARKRFTAKQENTEKLRSFLKSQTTGASVKQTCQDLREKSDNKYRQGFGSILGNIDALMNIGDLAIKSAPESVGLAWMGIRMCLHAVQGDWATFQLFSGACADIIGIMISCRVYGKMWGGKTGLADFHELHQQVADYIPTIYTKVLDFSYAVHRYASKLGIIRFTQNIFKDVKGDFETMINDIKLHDTKMRDYARTASERLTKHLQEKTLENQDAMRSELVTLRETLEVSLQANEAIIRKAFAELEEERKETRKKTPYEKAQDEYQENMRLLDPTEDQDEILRENLDNKREPGTCRWIFALDTYKQWHSSPQGAILWVSGAGGYGKSILMSTVIEELRAEDTTNDQRVVQYFFCKAGANTTRSSRQILHTIVAQLYTCTLAYPEQLDKANAAIAQALKKRADGPKSIENFDFELAYRGLLQIIEREVFLVIDAVDECGDRKEQKFLPSLRKLIENADSRVKIMLCSRPEADIAIALSRISNIKCEGHNQDDIRRNMRSEMNRFPGWTTSERDYAVEAVVDKSGGQFKYVQIALDFLRKPLVRPYQRAIDRLPDGLTGSYINSWNAIDPDYRDLLKIALTWVLFAEGSVTVPEIMDAYSRTYDNDVGVEDQETGSMATSNMTMSDGTNLHDNQILKAGGNFIDVSPSRSVNLRHLTVRDFFVAQEQSSNSIEEAAVPESSKETSITNRQDRAPTSPWTISAKYAHLEILKTIVQNLSSFAFQKDHVFPYLPEESMFHPLVQQLSSRNARKRAAAERVLRTNDNAEIWHALRQPDSDDSDEAGDSGTSLDGMNNDEDETYDVQNGERENGDEGDDVETNDPDVVADSNSHSNSDSHSSLADEEAASEDDDNHSDGSASTISLTSHGTRYAELDDIPGIGMDEDDTEVSEINVHNGQDRRYRYELTHLTYHLKEAQKLWTMEEQQSDPTWQHVWDLVIQFMSQIAAFEAWQDVIFRDEELPFQSFGGQLEYCNPLHIAARFGLTSLARELIDRDFDISERRPIKWWIGVRDSGSIIRRSPLDLAVRMDNMDTEMVKFLVKHSNADDLNEAGFKLVPFQQAISRNPSYEFVDFLLAYGADISVRDTRGWRALHHFAKSGTDPQVVNLLVDPKQSKEYMNLPTSYTRDTPLHILVNRDDPPLEVLEAFLKVGSDVNQDDSNSRRPLSALAARGYWKVVELLLSHGADVHDDDKSGRTAVHEAAHSGNRETLEVLVKHGAKVDAADFAGHTPLFHACDNNNEEAAMFLLQSLDASPILEVNKADDKGRTPLRQAAARGNIPVLKIILAKLNSVSSIAVTTAIHAFDTPHRQNALHKAAYHGRKATLELLLDGGGDASIVDVQKLTPFQLCVIGWTKRQTINREEVLMLMLDRGLGSMADRLDLVLKAVTRNSAKLVEKLIDTGTNPDTKDSHGWTLLMLAQQFNQEAVCEVIMRRLPRSTDLWPTRWATAKKIVKVSKSGLRVERNIFAEVTVISNHPIPVHEKKYYFEVEAVSNEPSDDDSRPNIGGVSVGYTTQTATCVSEREQRLTLDPYELCSYYGVGAKSRVIFEASDIVGCALDLVEKTIFFTKNGERGPPMFRNVIGRFSPAVMMGCYSQCIFRANFGTDLKSKPFLWEGWRAWYQEGQAHSARAI